MSCPKRNKSLLTPTLRVPLGLSSPNLVPCPPARSTAATLPFFIASTPFAVYFSLFFFISLISTAANGSIFLASPLSSALSLMLSTTFQSIMATCDISFLAASSPNASNLLITCSCLCSFKILIASCLFIFLSPNCYSLLHYTPFFY